MLHLVSVVMRMFLISITLIQISPSCTDDMGQQIQRKLGNYDRLWTDDKKRYKHDGIPSSNLLSNGMQNRSQPPEFKKPTGNMCPGSTSQRMSSNTLKPSSSYRSNIYKPTCPIDTSKHVPSVKTNSSSSYHMQPNKYSVSNLDNRNGLNKNLTLNTNMGNYQNTVREMPSSYAVCNSCKYLYIFIHIFTSIILITFTLEIYACR